MRRQFLIWVFVACVVSLIGSTAQSKQEMFVDAFDSEGLSNWNVESGKWKVEKGVLTQTDTTQNSAAVLKRLLETGVTLSVRMRQMSGIGCYLGLRSIDAKTITLFGINKPNLVRYFSLYPSKLVRDIAFSSPRGKWITVKMEIVGTKMRCYIDDKLITTGRVPPFPYEVYVWTYRASAEFDDLKIEPGPKKIELVDLAIKRKVSKYFRYQYGIPDVSFCCSEVCVDFNNDGKRQLVFGSRSSGRMLSLLNGADGKVVWRKTFKGASQNTTAYDIDDDGIFEILYSVSGPGILYLIDGRGNILKSWNSGDSKLGNSVVIIDGDGDGHLDGYLGSRSRYLIRLNMESFTTVKKRSGWQQCGCQTSAMDVDKNGIWDLFAGTGDDKGAKGVLHRFEPISLSTVWSYNTNDNASTADPVLVDIDGDGQVEVIKSVDNYARDDAHDALYAFEIDGTLIWKVDGLSGEDSPNVADLDNDGSVEIVGMTFGSEVYCLDAKGKFKWRRDLRPEYNNSAHAYMTPILCDLNGDRELEILAITNGPWGSNAPAVLYALSAKGEILDSFAVKNVTYCGSAYYCNIDDDPFMEFVLTGKGGMDVIETKGFGPKTEHFIRRCSYQRNNVIPWAYEDSYFIYRGEKEGVVNLSDNLVLNKKGSVYRSSGKFTTELLLLPKQGFFFNRLTYDIVQPKGTYVQVNIIDAHNHILKQRVKNGQKLNIRQPVKLEFLFSTTDRTTTPKLDAYCLTFDRE